MCFLASLCVSVRLSAPCHVATCFFLLLLLLLLLFISHSSQLSFVLFHLMHYWQLSCGCIECLCVCFLESLCALVRLSALCHIATCFFVVVVHFSLVTTLFCFISLDTLLATFLWLY